MSEKHRILEDLDRTYRAEAWYGASVLESLEGVTAPLAAKRAFKGGHTIWELVDHIASWNEIVAERLTGVIPKVTDEWNFPPSPKPTPAAWKATLRRLAKSQAKFRAGVAAFPEARLGRRRLPTKQNWSVLIRGQIGHQAYHVGQIAQLRRALGKPVTAQ